MTDQSTRLLESTASALWFHVVQKDLQKDLEKDLAACQGELLGGRRNGEGCYQSHDGKDLKLAALDAYPLWQSLVLKRLNS